SGLPSPSKSSTATACGLVPPTPVLSAIFNPEAAVTSVNCRLRCADTSAVRSSRTRRARQRMTLLLLALGPRLADHVDERRRVSKEHFIARRFAIAAEQMNHLQLVAGLVLGRYHAGMKDVGIGILRQQPLPLRVERSRHRAEVAVDGVVRIIVGVMGEYL